MAAVVLVASSVPDLGLPSSDPAATVPGVAVLVGMHVVVAADQQADRGRGDDDGRP